MLDQVDFPGPLPLLDPLFPQDRFADVFEELEMDQAGYAVFAGEFRSPSLPVFLDARWQIGGDADIKRPIPSAGENVDAGAFHGSIISRVTQKRHPCDTRFRGHKKQGPIYRHPCESRDPVAPVQ